MTRWTAPPKPRASSGTLSIFDQAERKKQQGIEASYQHANSYWRQAAQDALRECALTLREFTTNDVWDRINALGVTTGENRAMGAIMQAASRSGIIQKTGNYKESRRVSQHSQPIAIWRSNIYRGVS